MRHLLTFHMLIAEQYKGVQWLKKLGTSHESCFPSKRTSHELCYLNMSITFIQNCHANKCLKSIV